MGFTIKRSIKHLVLIFCICAVSCTAQESKNGIPEVVLRTFEQKYPKENSPEWEVDANGNFEAHFKKDGEKYRADFTPAGQWIETENSIKYDDLPEAVQDAIKMSSIKMILPKLNV
ncbi:PepSY-like domain-containing protein [Flavilitoribacter nigricans]|uniref:PepSY-like domain-containing protein n=1 Tax=Flavilitoribacter nigricans TaxID=70997 RepID=UPI001C9E7242|nr:PepSY-like domain-containing protein [Flavilitoribacter nigricans]